MCDFDIGDFVVWVGLSEGDEPTPEGDFDFVVGRPYRVSDLFPPEFAGDVWGAHFSDAPMPCGDPALSWDARTFRRVYRPDGSFISKLLEPVDLGAEVE